MGTYRGAVVLAGAGTGIADDVQETRRYIAHNARGIQLGQSYADAGEAMRAVERSLGGRFLKWIREDLLEVERYRAVDPLPDPDDIFGAALVFWARILPSPTGSGFVGFILYPGTTDVRIWGDGSGSGNSASSVSSATAPNFDSTDREMEFTRANDDHLVTTLSLPTTGYTLSFVGSSTVITPGTPARAIWVDSATDRILGELNGNWTYANPGLLTGPAANTNNQVTVVQAPTGADLYVGGTLVGSNAGTPEAGTFFISVAAPALGWQGPMREIVIVDRPASPPELAALAAYYRRVYPGLP